MKTIQEIEQILLGKVCIQYNLRERREVANIDVTKVTDVNEQSGQITVLGYGYSYSHEEYYTQEWTLQLSDVEEIKAGRNVCRPIFNGEELLIITTQQQGI